MVAGTEHLTDAQRRIALRMPEKDVQGVVDSLCLDLGLMHYHTYDSRRSREGFPDSVIVGPRGMVFRELKRQRERPSKAQQAWLDAMGALGMDVGVWRPSDVLDHTVRDTLLALSRFASKR